MVEVRAQANAQGLTNPLDTLGIQHAEALLRASSISSQYDTLAMEQIEAVQRKASSFSLPHGTKAIQVDWDRIKDHFNDKLDTPFLHNTQSHEYAEEMLEKSVKLKAEHGVVGVCTKAVQKVFGNTLETCLSNSKSDVVDCHTTAKTRFNQGIDACLSTSPSPAPAP